MITSRKLLIVVPALLIVAAWIALRSAPPPRVNTLPPPWEVTVSPDGSTSEVLGIRLGTTTLSEARQRFGGDLQLALIEQPDRQLALEGYAARVESAFVTGAVVLAAAAPPSLLDAARQRAIQSAAQPSGARRWSLSPADFDVALAMPVDSLTFVPSIRLDAAMVETRFGPAERTLLRGKRVHYLYPLQGIDVAVDESGKAVLQYLRPVDFARLAVPLDAAEANP